MFDFVYDAKDKGCGWLILALVVVLAIAFGFMCLEAWFIMLLWNAVAVAIFPTLPTIGFWLAFGVMLLCHFLFCGSSVVRTKRE